MLDLPLGGQIRDRPKRLATSGNQIRYPDILPGFQAIFHAICQSNYRVAALI